MFKPAMEFLEERRVLATLTWTGDVNNLWNANNAGDTNWDTNTLPADGDTLVFPAGAANTTNVNDTTAGNSYILQFTGEGYRVSGNSITLDLAGVDLVGNTNTVISTPFTLAPDTTIQVNGGPMQTQLDGVLSGATGGLTKTGANFLHLSANNTYGGATDVQQGLLALGLGGSINSSSAVTIRSGAALGVAAGETGAANAPIDGRAGSTIQLDSGANLTMGAAGSAVGFSTEGNITIASNAVLTLNDADRAALGPSTNLGGGTATLVAANGVALTAGDAITGTGTVQGAVDVGAGALRPGGGGVGDLNVTGNVTFGSTGAYEAHINGVMAGQFDTLDITGSATLNGARLNLQGSLLAVPGNSVTIFTTTAGITGRFTDASGNTLDEGDTTTLNGRPLSISYAGGSVTLTFDTTPTIDAGPGDNTIEVRQDAGGNVEVIVDGTTVLDTPATDITSLTVNGEGGTDRLTVNVGSFTGTNFPAGGVSFDGGPGADAMGVRGNGANNAVYTPSATTPGSGTVVVDGNKTIAFSNLTPVDIFGMNNATLNLPNANDVLTVQNGVDFTQGGTNPALRVSGTSGGVAIETAAFFNNTTMTIDTTATDGAADNITIASANNAHNNTNITINTGVGANDLLTVNGVTTVTGTFTGNVPTINLNNVINAATITGTATVINVDDPGQIQDAHDLAATLAPPGALVNVASGTYNENVTLSKNLRIDGADAPNRPVVNGGAAGSVFTIGAVTVLLDDLVIQNGAAANGGGINSSGTLTVRDSAIQNNVASVNGGGIFNSAGGALTIDASTITQNTASGAAANNGGGGLFNNGGTVDINAGTIIESNRANGALGSGGGIFNNTGGTIAMELSRIAFNEANRAGGGIEDNAGNSIAIVDSTLAGNVAGAPAPTPGNGGGIHITGAGQVSLDGSTVSGNLAFNEGGGLWNSATGRFTLTNSTISTNTALGVTGGGGIFNTGGGAGVMTLDSVTITLNSALAGGGIAAGTSGLSLRNTIVAQNTVGGNEQNLSGGPITNTGFNLIGDPDNGTLTPPSATNIFSADAKLGPLTNNGGPTLTHRPFPGSPAIGFGDTTLTVDQRNVARPQGGNDDIGAVEVDLNGFEISAGAQAGDGNPDVFRIVNGFQGMTPTVDVYVNGVLTQYNRITTGQLLIFGSSDDDTLIVDNSLGLVGQQIVFFGDGGITTTIPQVPQGAGFDKLQLVGTTPATTIYNPGETPDAGAVFQTANEFTQRVEFFGLEPVQVRGTGAADTLILGSQALGAGFPQALQADNAINYRVGPNTNDPFNPVFVGDSTGLLTVDGYESLEFSNFGTLNINAGAGSDEINLNNPTQPTALANINVDGGDPTASDTAIVNGTTAADAITFTPTASDAGTVQVNLLPLVTLTTVEHLTINGQGGNDNLTVLGTAAADTIVHTPGAAADAGAFRVNALLPMDYANLGATSTLTVNGAGQPGGTSDRLVAYGTLGNDVLEVAATTGAVTLRDPASALVHRPITPVNVEALTLEALDGDDSFVVNTPQPYAQVAIAGGGPGGSDRLSVLGAVGVAQAFTVSPGIIPGEGRVNVDALALPYRGIEHLLLGDLLGNGAGATDSLVINDDFSDNTWNVGGGFVGDLVQIDDRESIDISGFNTVQLVNQSGTDYFRVAPTRMTFGFLTSFTVSGDAAAPVDDVLELVGTDAADVVTAAANTVTVNGVTITVGNANFAALRVSTLDGADNINFASLNVAVPLEIYAGDGNDTVALAGLTTHATVDAGAGNDLVRASTGAAVRLTLLGGDGDDALFGGAGADRLEGGPGDDVLVGGGGDDFAYGGDGSDTFIWNPGDADDLFEGGEGDDTLAFAGANGTDNYFVSADQGRVLFQRTQGNIGINMGSVETILANSETIQLSGRNEVPPNNTTSNGFANFTYNAATGLFDVRIFVLGLAQADLADSHIHMSIAGANGPVVVPFGGGANYTPTAGGLLFTATGLSLANISPPAGFTAQDVLVEMLLGRAYFNVHSTALPGGELRGNIIISGPTAGSGGADSLTVRDVTGTALRNIAFDAGNEAEILAGAPLTDTVTVEGLNTADHLLAARTNTLDNNYAVSGLPYNILVTGSDGNVANGANRDRLVLNGNGGDDLIQVAAGLEAVTLATLNGNAGNDTLIGNAGDDTLNGGDGDDTIDGRGGTNTVDGGAGTNTILVSGTAAGETITTTHTMGVFTITGGPSAGVNNITAMQQVRIEAGAGSDTINVNTLAAGGLNYEVRGGNPIGAVGDTLNVISPNGLTFMPGPKADSGAFVDNVTGNIISYDEIEDANATLTTLGAITVMGTGADDDITVVGVAPNTVDVQVNDGPVVRYAGVNAINIQGKNGDDDITIDVNVAALGVTINLDGGLPTAGSDTLRVTGVDGTNDAPTWTPNAADGGTLQLAGQAPIVVTAIERLIYDGESDDETLTITGAGDFLHAPGTAPDRGRFALVSGATTFLGIDYENLGLNGTVTANGTGANDSLTVLGTDTADAISVAFLGPDRADFDVLGAFGIHVDVLSNAVENYFLDSAQGGFDDIFLNGAVNASGRFEIYGGGPSDTLHLIADATIATVTISPSSTSLGFGAIAGFGAPTIVFGEIDGIQYNGDAAADDTLILNPGAGDNRVRVERGTTGNLATSDTLPPIEFTGHQRFVVDASGFGSDVVTFKTWFVGGPAPVAAYDMIGGPTDTLVIEGSDGAGAAGNDSYTVFDPAPVAVGDPVVAVRDNNGTQITVRGFGNLGRVQINTLGGDDLVTVDTDGGLIGVPLTYDGGLGHDLLVVTGAIGANNVVYTPGAATTAGRLDYDGQTMLIDFVGLEPVVDLIPATTLTVNGTNANNAINYQQTPGDATRGRVSVDGFEYIDFSGKTNLVLNGLAGSDTFNLNNPSTPTGLMSIAVNGGDPTGSDTAIVNGTAAQNAIVVDQLTAAGARIVGAQPVTVVIATTEHIAINGLNGNDTLNLITPAGSDTITYNPGATVDAASVQVGSFVPLSFTNLGAGGAVTLSNNGGGRADTLIYNGTAANDTFTLPAGTGPIALNAQLPVATPGVNNVVLNGLAGDDTFNVAAVQAYASIALAGGDPSASDVANLTGDGAAGIIVHALGSPTPSVTGGGLGTVNLTGVEIANINIGGGGQRIEFRDAGPSDDKVRVTVLSATAGVVQVNGVAPIVNYTGANNTAGSEPFFNFTGNGEDELTVIGNALAQRIDVDVSTATGGFVAFDDSPVGAGVLGQDGRIAFPTADSAANGTFQPNSLEVFGLEGDDTFNVTAGPNIPVFLDGGDPIGVTPGDRINAVGGGGAVFFEPGPENDEGGIRVGTNARISFDHIESVTIDGAMCAIIVGTNGDDDITIIARTELALPPQFVGADGVRDFTTSVNGGPEVLWLNTPDVYVDGLSGDDDITVQTRALDANGNPVAANWDVDVRIVGGPPSAPERGDRVVVQTPGADTVIYTPTGSDTGRLVLDTDGDGVYTAASQDSQIQLLAQFLVDCDGIPDSGDEYRSSHGGIESLFYDGEGANDNFAVVGTAGNDTIVHTPGNGIDEGVFRVNMTLAISYQNLGATGTITVDGAGNATAIGDTLIARGTSGSDTIVVGRISDTVGSITVNDHLPLRTTSTTGAAANTVERYRIDSLEGDDAVTINYPLATGVTQVAVNAGGPGGSDSLTINGAAATNETFTVTPGNQPGNGNVQVAAVANPYSGIEHIFLAGNAGDTDNITINDDGADNLWTVKKGAVGDLVQIGSRETIDINTFNNVSLVNLPSAANAFTTDAFRVHPTHLVSYAGTFTINGDATAAPVPLDDVLELIGTEGADTVTAGATTVTVNGKTITVGNTNFAELRISTLGGNDVIGHNGQGGNPAPLALALNGVRTVIDAGAGNDIVNASALAGTVGADIYGGDGDDNLVGSPLADTIYGGRGNDILIGGAGADTLYGEEGNDLFGNPSAAANGVADDAGDDRFFGGPGSDTFVWEPGDGSDTIEGGSEEADVLIFFGGGDEIYNVFAKVNDPSRAILHRTLANGTGVVTMDMAGVDQINLNGQGGLDRVVVGRANDGDRGNTDAPTSPYTDPTATLSPLHTTEVRVVNVDLGANVPGEAVFVDGLATDDHLTVSLESSGGNVVRVSGLPYLVRISNATTADRLTIRGNEGDDTVKSINPTGGGAASVEGVIGITLAGGAGNDYLSADAILIGGIGDDFLEGGAGDDMLFGNEGEDTLVGRGGNDTIDGGPDYDTILVRGTSADDVMQVIQTAANTLVYTVQSAASGLVDGGTQTDTIALVGGVPTVERVQILALAGDDVIRVSISDTLFNTPNASLLFDIDGGPARTRDRLAVIDDATDDLSIYRKAQSDSAGTITIGPANPEPFDFVFDNVEYAEVLDDTNRPITQANNNGRLVVFKHDPFEANNDILVGTHLGAAQTINVDPTIDPGSRSIGPPFNFTLPADEDWYRVEALATGTLDFQAFFEQIANVAGPGSRPGLPGNGDLQLQLFDNDGTLIVDGVAGGVVPEFGLNDATSNERIRIPAVQGQIYYLRVFGATGEAVNNYTLTIINEPPPTPFDLELADNLVILTGAQENPPVATNANGTANFQFNPATGRFNIDLFVTGLELTDTTPLPQLTDSHIHVGAPGVNGPVIVPFGVTGWVQEPAGIRLRLTDQLFPAANVADLLAGNTYINVHSSANATGEVRGQINIPNVLGVSDSGRSQFDNVTNDNTPTIYLRLDDAILLNDMPGNAAGVPGAAPPDEVIPIPFNNTTGASPVGLTPGFRVAIYDESNTHSPVLLGFAQPVPNLNGVYSFTFSTPLAEGSHFISSRVQMIDPADNDAVAGTVTRATGFGPRSQSLEIVVDTVPPPVFFGLAADPDDGLAVDPGVIPQPPTVVDNKTNDETPSLWGVAEANAVVRLWLDFSPNNGVDNFDLLLGTAQAIPIDGTNQFPNGQWEITSHYNLNDPQIVNADSDPATPGVQPVGIDGVRRLLLTAEDLAGNQSPAVGAAQALNIFVDTQGPQVTGVFIGQTDLIGLTGANTLLRFNSAAPGHIRATVPITGLAAGETVVGIDFRPANGLLYGVVNGPGPDRIITINPVTGAITASVNLTADPTDATNPFAGLNGASFGVDFNPVPDRLRVVSDTGQNLRINVANGQVITDGDLTAGSTVTGAAYTNNLAGATSTTLYDIDVANDRLMRQDPPNNGTLVAVGLLGVNAATAAGFDIAPGTNVAYAALNVAGAVGLYRINLNTGAATAVGAIGAGGTALVGLSAVPAFDLFDPKPILTPTPLIDKLVVRVQDLPARVLQFPNPAVNPTVAVNPGHFLVVGDSNGIIPIMSVTFTPDPIVVGQPATGSLTLMFFEPLPDDRFTLTVRDGIVDDVGNALDGESNANEPQNNPLFPSGDGQPGGDFVARFTVDSRPEVAVYSGRSVFVDTNGNGILDPRNQKDYTDRDVIYRFGLPTDDLFVGNFATNFGAEADGFDKLAAYGNIGGAYRFLIDTNNDGVPEPIPGFPTNTAAINGHPVAGNFDGNAANGDEVGLFDGQTWYLDTNHNFNVNPAEGDLVINGVIRGVGFVGDFDGNGVVDLATFNDFRNRFEIDLRGPGFVNGNLDVVMLFGFPGTNERPVAADFNRDGITDIGLYAPQQGAGTPEEQAFFHILVTQLGAGGVPQPLWLSNRSVPIPTPTDLAGAPPTVGSFEIHYRPEPFGKDLLLPFGEDFALPLFGNFDPPVGPDIGTFVAPIGQGQTDTNPQNPLDVNADGIVSTADLLPIITSLRAAGGTHDAFKDDTKPFLDVNADNLVSVADLLPIIQHLKSQLGQTGEGERAASAPAATTQTFVGVAVESSRSAATDERAIAAATEPAGWTTPALDVVAADVASAGGGQAAAAKIELWDEEADDLEDAIDSIAEDLAQTR